MKKIISGTVVLALLFNICSLMTGSTAYAALDDALWVNALPQFQSDPVSSTKAFGRRNMLVYQAEVADRSITGATGIGGAAPFSVDRPVLLADGLSSNQFYDSATKSIVYDGVSYKIGSMTEGEGETGDTVFVTNTVSATSFTTKIATPTQSANSDPERTSGSYSNFGGTLAFTGASSGYDKVSFMAASYGGYWNVIVASVRYTDGTFEEVKQFLTVPLTGNSTWDKINPMKTIYIAGGAVEPYFNTNIGQKYIDALAGAIGAKAIIPFTQVQWLSSANNNMGITIPTQSSNFGGTGNNTAYVGIYDVPVNPAKTVKAIDFYKADSDATIAKLGGEGVTSITGAGTNSIAHVLYTDPDNSSNNYDATLKLNRNNYGPFVLSASLSSEKTLGDIRDEISTGIEALTEESSVDEITGMRNSINIFIEKVKAVLKSNDVVISDCFTQMEIDKLVELERNIAEEAIVELISSIPDLDDITINYRSEASRIKGILRDYEEIGIDVSDGMAAVNAAQAKIAQLYIQFLPGVSELIYSDKNAVEEARAVVDGYMADSVDVSGEFLAILETVEAEMQLIIIENNEEDSFEKINLKYDTDLFESLSKYNTAYTTSSKWMVANTYFSSGSAINEDSIVNSNDFDELSNEFVLDGIPYKLGGVKTDENGLADDMNTVFQTAITVDLPLNAYGKISYIATSSSSSKASITVTYNYTDGTSENDVNIIDICGYRDRIFDTPMQYTSLLGGVAGFRNPTLSETYTFGVGYGGGVYAYYGTPDKSKILKSVTLKSASKIALFGLTGVTAKTRRLKQIVDTYIPTITANNKNRDTVLALLNIIEAIKEKGGVIDEAYVEKINAIDKKLIRIKDYSLETDLHYNTLQIEFSGPINETSITKDNFTLYKDNTKYGKDYTIAYNVVDGKYFVEVKFENEFDYGSDYSVLVSKNVLGSDGFAFFNDKTISANSEPLVELEAVVSTAGSTKNVAVRIKNNLPHSQSHFVLVALYSDKNEMVQKEWLIDTLDSGEEQSETVSFILPSEANENWKIECIPLDSYVNCNQLFKVLSF